MRLLDFVEQYDTMRMLVDLVGQDAALSGMACSWCPHDTPHVGFQYRAGPCRPPSRGLGELFDERLYPRTTRRLPLSQDEVAHLAGISRPSANRALHELERLGVLSVAYGTVLIHDPQELQRLGSLH